MEDVVETIRAAIAPDASAEARAAGAHACRAMLAVLAPEPVAAAPATPPIANLVAALRGVPSQQLLDLAIQKLRTALPPGTEIASVKPLNFQFVPIRGAKP